MCASETLWYTEIKHFSNKHEVLMQLVLIVLIEFSFAPQFRIQNIATDLTDLLPPRKISEFITSKIMTCNRK